jgi:hypothetical protein
MRTASRTAAMAMACCVLMAPAAGVDVDTTVKDLLEAMPSWSDPAADRMAMVTMAMRISQHATADIRAAIDAHIARKRLTRAYDTAEMAKLFVLMRIIYDLPPDLPKAENRFFAGFTGVPITETTVDVAWPVGWRKGRIVVAGDFQDYTGEDYQALREFDWFRVRYARRMFPGVAQDQ